jgi:ATP-dependent Clp protease ATP-binding subunit ClpX
MGRRQGSDVQRCSFCHRDTGDVDRLISGPEDVYICDECVALCVEILEEEKQSEEQAPTADSITMKSWASTLSGRNVPRRSYR